MQLPNLLGVTTTAEYPDGGKSEPWSAAIAAPFGKRTLSAQAALANVDARIKADHRFSTSSVSIIRPLDGAPILTVTLSEAASVARGESMALAVFGDLEQYEGSFVKVVDSSGSVVRVAGYATFTGIGIGIGVRA